MLRRAPTAITLTADDIAAYEENRLARLARLANPHPLDPSRQDTLDPSRSDASHKGQNIAGGEGRAGGSGGQGAEMVDPHEELKPFPEDKGRGGREARIMGR